MARQERMIVAGKVQIEMSAGERPPDALISRSGYPRGGAEAEGNERLIFGVDKVAKLVAVQRSVARLMIAG